MFGRKKGRRPPQLKGSDIVATENVRYAAIAAGEIGRLALPGACRSGSGSGAECPRVSYTTARPRGRRVTARLTVLDRSNRV